MIGIVDDYVHPVLAEPEEEAAANPLKTKTEWACGQCDALHEWRSEAGECCAPPPPEEVQVWACPHCDKWHQEPTDAVSCCGDRLTKEASAEREHAEIVDLCVRSARARAGRHS